MSALFDSCLIACRNRNIGHGPVSARSSVSNADLSIMTDANCHPYWQSQQDGQE